MSVSPVPDEVLRRLGPPLLVCAGGKSSAEGTEVPAVEPPVVNVVIWVWDVTASGFHLIASSSTGCLPGLQSARRACMLFCKNSAHTRIRALCQPGTVPLRRHRVCFGTPKAVWTCSILQCKAIRPRPLLHLNFVSWSQLGLVGM